MFRGQSLDSDEAAHSEPPLSYLQFPLTFIFGILGLIFSQGLLPRLVVKNLMEKNLKNDVMDKT